MDTLSHRLLRLLLLHTIGRWLRGGERDSSSSLTAMLLCSVFSDGTNELIDRTRQKYVRQHLFVEVGNVGPKGAVINMLV